MPGGIVYRIPNGRRGDDRAEYGGGMTISGLVFKIILDHGRAAVNKQLAAGKQPVHAVIAAKHHYVRIGARSSVFFGAVIRSELDEIVIGEGTNIQDNCVLHIERGIPVHVGSGCTIGHSAIVHSCTVGDNTLVGMGAIILNGAVVGKNCIIGAGALIPQNAVIPDGSLVVGMPGKVRRSVTEEEIATNRASAQMYMEEAAEYKAQFSNT